MNTPVLETRRLLLRPLQHDDVELIFFLRSDDSVNRFISRTRAISQKDAADFIARILGNKQDINFYWVMVLKYQLQPVGTICLWNFSADRKTAELGYELHPGFHGHGLMQEATAAVIAFAFSQLQLAFLEACTNRDHQRSIRVLEKNGFTLLPDKIDDEVPSNAVYQLQNPAFYSRAKDP